MTDRYITTRPELVELCRQLQSRDWIALDTEFIREKTYYPRLCLIQVADPGTVACIDPLAIDDLSPLWQVLFDQRIIKVFHSAGQDLEIIHQLTQRVPKPLFDTQLAATVLGHGEQIGYGPLVREVLGVELDKSHSRTDWSQRPLEDGQLRYAADDVRYLRQLFPRLREELERRGRLEWLRDDFAELADPRRYRIRPEEAWRRVRGLQVLKGVQLNILQALADWRERQAMDLDRPRRWILGDEILLDLARRRPSDERQLGKIRGLESGNIRRFGATLLELIARAGAEPRERWPRVVERPRLTPQQEALVDAMMALLRLLGQDKAISPQTLAGRRELEQVVLGEEAPVLHGWRAALAGDEIQALLRGERVLRVYNGKLVVVED